MWGINIDLQQGPIVYLGLNLNLVKPPMNSTIGGSGTSPMDVNQLDSKEVLLWGCSCGRPVGENALL